MEKSDKPELSAYFFYLILFGLVILFFTGCTTPSPGLQTIPAGYEIKGGDESVIFGRIKTPKGTFGVLDKLNKTHLLVMSKNPGKDYTVVCDMGGSDSYFFVTLPPGTYTIKKVRRGDGYSSPSLSFVVESGHISYLGSLKFVLQKEGSEEDVFGRFFEAIEDAFKKGFKGTTEEATPEDWHREYDTSYEMKTVRHSESFIKGDWQVEDEYEEAVKVFRKRYPQIEREIIKSLFRKEDGS